MKPQRYLGKMNMRREHERILNKSVMIYNKAAKEYGVSNRAVLWNDAQTQYYRFSELTKYMDLNSSAKTVLDIGCGNCELYKFLNFMGFRGHYTGYDINKKLLNQAKRRFGDIDIHLIDIMTIDCSAKFDYVVMSGLFNVNINQSKRWVFQFIEKMFSMCREVLIFNMISTHVNYKEPGMFYLNPTESLSFCLRKLSPRVTLSHYNLPYNYTVYVFRSYDWQSVKENDE